MTSLPQSGTPALTSEQIREYLLAASDAYTAVVRERDEALALLELERRKDHGLNAFTEGYNTAMADYAAGRISGWPKRKAKP